MKVYYLEKSRFAKTTLLLLAIGFGGLFLFFGYAGVFLLGSVTAVTGLVIIHCAGNMKVIVNDDFMQIIREASSVFPRILKEKQLTIAFSDIQRIKKVNTIWYAFHLIKLKNGKNISLYRENNLELDRFIAELNSKLEAESSVYKTVQKEKREKEEKYIILFILLVTIILPLAFISAALVSSEALGYAIISVPCAAIIILAGLIGRT